MNFDWHDAKKAARSLITIHRERLVSALSTASDKTELEWELRLYDYMLQDPDHRLNQLNATRFDDTDAVRCSKKEAVQKLGWTIQ